MPDADHAQLRFQRFEQCSRHPVVIYVDFESLNEPIDEVPPDPRSSARLLRQRPVHFGLLLVSDVPL